MVRDERRPAAPARSRAPSAPAVGERRGRDHDRRAPAFRSGRCRPRVLAAVRPLRPAGPVVDGGSRRRGGGERPARRAPRPAPRRPAPRGGAAPARAPRRRPRAAGGSSGISRRDAAAPGAGHVRLRRALDAAVRPSAPPSPGWRRSEARDPPPEPDRSRPRAGLPRPRRRRRPPEPVRARRVVRERRTARPEPLARGLRGRGAAAQPAQAAQAGALEPGDAPDGDVEPPRDAGAGQRRRRADARAQPSTRSLGRGSSPRHACALADGLAQLRARARGRARRGSRRRVRSRP